MIPHSMWASMQVQSAFDDCQLSLGMVCWTPFARAASTNTQNGPTEKGELFENDFKGGSSGCPGALRTHVNGASGYPDVTAHALCGFLRLESGFFFLLSASFKNFPSVSFLVLYQHNLILKVFHIHVASLSLKAISHALTGPISS